MAEELLRRYRDRTKKRETLRRMKRKEFNLREIEEGAYYPGVFMIKLNKSLYKGVQYDDFDNEDWQTFVHEYVHFLQDISTGHGYLYFFFKSQRFNLALYEIKNNSSIEIKLPIRTEDTGVKNASGKEMLLDFYEGDSRQYRFHHINRIALETDEISTELFSEQSDLEMSLHSVNIYYNDEDNPYHFGNECVIESMAYLIEHHLFGARERINEFPYNTCELICREICPGLLQEPERIVMLAEIALMCDDCGKAFYKLINHCAENEIWDLKEDDFKDFCLRSSEVAFGVFDEAYRKAIEGIDILFPISFPYTAVTNMQLKVFLKCGHNYRKRNKLFISDAFKHPDSKQYFKYLIALFDIPMLIDGNGNRYGKEGTQNIPVADAFLSLLTIESDMGCGLQSFCLESKLECYEKNMCTHYPWRQCDSNEFCPIAVYFKGYGLDKKQYKWRESRLIDRRALEFNEAQSIIGVC